MSFKLGDWVVFDPPRAQLRPDFVPDPTPRMVVDLSPVGPLMVVASLDPETGDPVEFLTCPGGWRPA